MKKNSIVSVLLLCAMVVTGVQCKQRTSHAQEHAQEHTSTYTCPMHPTVVQSTPGTCPICGMDLVPATAHQPGLLDSNLLADIQQANAGIAGNLSFVTPQSGMRIFSLPVQGVVNYDSRQQVNIASRVSGRIEKLYVRYNYQPVKKGQLLMHIYSPDLAAAQRELIYISRNDNNPALLQSARQRLLLLGMQPAQIRAVLKTGSPVYQVPVYSTVSGFIVDQSLFNSVSELTPASATSTAGGSSSMGGMEATPTNTARGRTTINNSPVLVQPGQYVNAGETIFNIYQSGRLVADFSFDPALADKVRTGSKLVFHTLSNPGQTLTGMVTLVEPVQRRGSNFTTARIYLDNQELQPGQLLSGNIPVVAKGWWLPGSAVVSLGNGTVVYKKEGSTYTPQQVVTGVKAGGMVQVLDSIADWQVVQHAAYVTGSESFIKTSSNQ